MRKIVFQGKLVKDLNYLAPYKKDKKVAIDLRIKYDFVPSIIERGNLFAFFNEIPIEFLGIDINDPISIKEVFNAPVNYVFIIGEKRGGEIFSHINKLSEILQNMLGKDYQFERVKQFNSFKVEDKFILLYQVKQKCHQRKSSESKGNSS